VACVTRGGGLERAQGQRVQLAERPWTVVPASYDRDRADEGKGPGIRQGRAAIPETRYTKTDDGVHLAYQVSGAGPLDVVMAPGFVAHVELAWDMPFYASMLRRVRSFARVITFDKRGTGLSDQTVSIATLEERMDDVRTVMDAVSMDRRRVDPVRRSVARLGAIMATSSTAPPR
jgi:hypothetical protein